MVQYCSQYTPPLSPGAKIVCKYSNIEEISEIISWQMTNFAVTDYSLCLTDHYGQGYERMAPSPGSVRFGLCRIACAVAYILLRHCESHVSGPPRGGGALISRALATPIVNLVQI
jgi:hypothetical protein